MLDPVGFYGIGKAAAEMYVRKMCREGEVDYAVLRIGNAYGVEQLRSQLSVGLVAKSVAAAKTGDKLRIWGGGENARDYIHAEDVASACLAAIESRTLVSGNYNVGSGVAVSNREVVDLVEKTLGLNVDVEFLPPRPFDVGSICLDCNALRSATTWRPMWRLQDGIRQIAAAFKL